MKVTQNILLCILFSFFSFGCIGIVKKNSITETNKTIKINKNDKIALLVPIIIDFHDHISGRFFSSNKEYYNVHREFYAKPFSTHKMAIVKEAANKLGADVVFYASSFSSTDALIRENKVSNIKLISSGEIMFKNSGRYLVDWDPSWRNSRIYDLNKLPKSYNYFIIVGRGNGLTVNYFHPVYRIISILTWGSLPIWWTEDCTIVVRITDENLQDVKSYEKNASMMQFTWLPLIVTFGVFENKFNYEDGFMSCLNETANIITTDIHYNQIGPAHRSPEAVDHGDVHSPPSIVNSSRADGH